jgi:LysR family transcriptional regulator, chromosome initiation inhibitor
MAIDYPALFALAAVIREGSFERAARALYVTPSAISQRIKLLEERVATAAGRWLCRHAQAVAMLEADLQRDLPQLAAPTDAGRPTLRVVVNADSLATWFVPAMAQFAEQDEALLDVALDDQEHTAGWLRQGEVLAAVTAEAQPLPACRAERLGKLRYLAVANPAFVRRHFAAGARTACSRTSCAASAAATSTCRATGCRPARPSSTAAWPAWAGA